MQRCYLVCYDIRDPTRLRRVHRVVKGYGGPWQYSIFFCKLKEIDRARLQADLEMEMNLKEDQAIILDLGSDEQRARRRITVLGRRLPKADDGTLVL